MKPASFAALYREGQPISIPEIKPPVAKSVTSDRGSAPFFRSARYPFTISPIVRMMGFARPPQTGRAIALGM